MGNPHLPLNAVRAFEAAARHLGFTKAGLELRVTQAAVSHLVKSLEATLGVPLFRRVPRGLALMDEGQALLPAVSEAFGQLRGALDAFAKDRVREIVTVGVVGTFAAGWLLPRLQEFHKSHPHIDLRILTNNNRVDIAGEGLDFAIRFGDGLWHGTEATHLMSAPLSPLCSPKIGKRLRKFDALAKEVLLRSYRDEEWRRFDASIVMAHAAARGEGVALLPVRMFAQEIREKTRFDMLRRLTAGSHRSGFAERRRYHRSQRRITQADRPAGDRTAGQC